MTTAQRAPALPPRPLLSPVRLLDRRLLPLLPLAAILAAAPACGGRAGGEGVPMPAPAFRHSAFRVRADPAVPLNSDRGWAGLANEEVRVSADRPFRIRFEIEGAPDPEAPRAFRLQVRRNGGSWENVAAADFPYPDEIASPRVSVVAPTGYAGGAATADLLHGSALPFRAGAGVGLDSLAGPVPAERGQGEWEWSLVIRRFADGAVTSDEGDRFEFRMADARGLPLGEGPLPSLTLTVPPRLLGGTFVETPGRLGPWQASNGALYFVMEPAETDNVLMVVSSPDGGLSWREVDGANRPETDDLEGFATAFHGGTIHMLHQTSRFVRYHAFRTSDDSEAPDSWAVRDEQVAAPGEPPTQVAALAAREDGSLVAVYGDSTGLRYRIRSPQGAWGPEARVEEPSGHVLSGPQVEAGADGVVHLAYTARDGKEGSVWARTIGPAGELGSARWIADGVGLREEDAGAVLPLVHLPEGNTLAVLFRTQDGGLWERRIGGDGTPSLPVRVTERRVVQSAVDSDQVGADAIAHGSAVQVLFIDEATGDLFHVQRGVGGAWEPAAPVVEGIDAQWVRGNRVRRPDGRLVYGFVYDAGSGGGSGMNRYGEVPLEGR